jgi:predicted site-specific integrase-resolvase
MKAIEVMNMLDICRQTLCRYVKLGKIKVKAKIANNNYIYDDRV